MTDPKPEGAGGAVAVGVSSAAAAVAAAAEIAALAGAGNVAREGAVEQQDARRVPATKVRVVAGSSQGEAVAAVEGSADVVPDVAAAFAYPAGVCSAGAPLDSVGTGSPTGAFDDVVTVVPVSAAATVAAAWNRVVATDPGGE